jgi:hypothetical protein
MPKLKRLTGKEWYEILLKWAKRFKGNIISRQKILEIAESLGIDAQPRGNYGWPQFASALDKLKRDGRMTYVSRGVYCIR